MLWQQLLVCRRANLMSLIPLTDQRLQQLTATADSLATSIQAQLEAMRPQMDGLALFASANQSTAEELMQTTGAEALVGCCCFEPFVSRTNLRCQASHSSRPRFSPVCVNAIDSPESFTSLHSPHVHKPSNSHSSNQSNQLHCI